MKNAKKRDEVCVGQTYAWLLVVGEPMKRGKSYVVPCRCACGRDISTDLYHLVKGRTRSCGCNGRGEKDDLGRILSDLYQDMVAQMVKDDPRILGLNLLFRTKGFRGVGGGFCLSLIHVRRADNSSTYGWHAYYQSGELCDWAGNINYPTPSEAAQIGYRHLGATGILDARTTETCVGAAGELRGADLRYFMTVHPSEIN